MCTVSETIIIKSQASFAKKKKFTSKEIATVSLMVYSIVTTGDERPIGSEGNIAHE